MRVSYFLSAVIGILLLVLMYIFVDTDASQDQNETPLLVMSNGQITPVERFPEIIQSLVGEVCRDGKHKTIILFIHGRGNYPEKAFENGTLKALEKDYSAKVIMFHWPAAGVLFSFPQKEARSASKELWSVLDGLNTFKKNKPGNAGKVRFVLFTQSMGSLVLEETVSSRENNWSKHLFDTIVITSSASDANKQKAWLDRIGFSPAVYVTVNRSDPLLRVAELYFGKHFLGSMPLLESNLSQKTFYIDVSKADLGHRFYLHKYLTGSTQVKNFFDQVLQGIPFAMASGWGSLKKENPRMQSSLEVSLFSHVVLLRGRD